MKAHSIKTDNANVGHKVKLRQIATAHLDSLRVLDLFAGYNVLWNNFDCDKYYGIEIEKNKGNNLNADNVRVIQSLDLSQFNVIDCDSYGIPLKQMEKIFSNETLKDGTVIIYTCIGNSMSALSTVTQEMFGLVDMYKKCKVLFNNKSSQLFFGYLYNKGIREVFQYTEESATFSKQYGYFVCKTK